jgi:hypothetical protein
METSAAPSHSGIGDEIRLFVHNIDALHTAMSPVTMMIVSMLVACQRNLKTFVEKHSVPAPDGQKPINIPPDQATEFVGQVKWLQKAQAVETLLPQTFIVALVSQYDAFLGRLLRCIYRAKPDLLEQSERQFTYADLADFSNIEEAKEHILEKEVEALLRESHAEQFDQLQTRFKIKLKVNLPIWPTFIEVTERRNLFVHCNGRVSKQYLTVCDRQKVQFSQRPAIGDHLGASPEYFNQAYACIFEIGTKLAHVLWRKILPDERGRADVSLQMLCYDLLVARKHSLAVTMGIFATEVPKKWSSEQVKRMMIVNLAQAYKWTNQADKATNTINKQDWSSCAYEFQLAVAVLKDEFQKAAEIMKTIGASGSELVGEDAYRNWPLFTEFRKSPIFQEAYKSVYGHAFVPVQLTPIDTLFQELETAIAKSRGMTSGDAKE